MAEAVSGKVMIITGASSGIGRAAARLFAANGAKLVLVARSAEKLAALSQVLGTETLIIPADLTKPADVESVVARTESAFGHIDILFANAGTYISGNVAEGNADEWDRMIELNVNAVFRMVRAALPGMIRRKSGDIVITSSISGHQAIQWEPVYSATKHAVQSFTHGVRRQVAPHKVRIGALAPGMVLNELWGITDRSEINRLVSEHKGLRSEDIAEALLFMLTRPAHVAIRDLVILPQNQDL